jgi:hypothetical protein
MYNNNPYPQAPYQPVAPAPRPKSDSKTPLIIGVVISSLLAVGFLISTIIFFQNYTTSKTDVDGQIAQAVAVAVNEQIRISEENFAEREKSPFLTFTGPGDYGSLSFDYPRTWNLFIQNSAVRGGTYSAFMSPRFVINPSEQKQFALRVTIESRAFENVLNDYQRRIANGELKSAQFALPNDLGLATRLDGAFDSDVTGAALIFKIRDKTVILRTDAATFLQDFNTLIQTINFNA